MAGIRYGIDVDETLLALLPSLIQFNNEVHGTKIRLEDFTSYVLYPVMCRNLEETTKRLHQFYNTPYFQDIQPVPGASEGVARLRKNGTLHAITSREKIITLETKTQIKTIFSPASFLTLNFTNNHTLEQNTGITKPEVCRKLKIDIMIEDCLEHALDCSKVVGFVYLLDLNHEYVWNHTDKPLPGNVKRVYSWDEIE